MTMAHRGEVVTDNDEERRKNAGGRQARHGPPPSPGSPEAVNARAEQGRGSHPPITPGADGADKFDKQDLKADDVEVEGATSAQGM
jgi:hypothetical protein